MALLVLTVRDGIATGGMEGTAAFMPLRGHGMKPFEQNALESHDDLYVEVSPSGQRLTYSQS